MRLNIEYLNLNYIIFSREPLKVLTNNLCKTLTLDVFSSSLVTNSNDDSSILESENVVLYQFPPFFSTRILETFHHYYRTSVTSNKYTFLIYLLKNDQKIELL